MDATQASVITLASMGLGYVWQWARAPKQIPNWLSYVGFILAGATLWFWATPKALELINQNWRVAILMATQFVLAARGTASASRDAKIAPVTNSL